MPDAISQFAARQLSRPSGPIGRWLLPRLWNRRNRALNDAAFAALGPAAGDRILEVGFGGGYLLAKLAAVVGEGALAGADASPAIVANAQRRFRALLAGGKLALECADVESLPFPAAAFDKTCSVNSIFYWPHLPPALAELARVTTPGGRLVLVFTDAESLENRAVVRYAATRLTVDEVRELVRAAGFVEVEALPDADRHRRFWRLVARRVSLR